MTAQNYSAFPISDPVPFTPVAGSIFGPLSQTHISRSEVKNDFSISALLDIQLTLFCVCGVNSFLPELEHLKRNVFTVSFPKRMIRNLGVFLRLWVEVEVNFLRREKLSRRDYLDYLRNRAKFGDIAVFELTFRNVSLGKLSKIWSCYRRKWM